MTLQEWKSQYQDIAADDPVIQRYLDMFRCMYAGDYGCMADSLQGWFVAHYITYSSSNPKDPTGGIVTTKTVGDVSIGSGAHLAFQGRSDANHMYFTTYGQMFMDAIALFGGGPMIAGAYCG
ncbi:MAG: DUF4054 domain-containing protein [Aeromonadaceae bacterium]